MAACGATVIKSDCYRGLVHRSVTVLDEPLSALNMKLLHTSYWHLGRSLYGRKRDEEFGQFLQWMVQTVREREIDVLVVAGDVFDTATPGNRAQALYYQFLHQMVASPCRHIVIVAGNHDSPSFLKIGR